MARLIDEGMIAQLSKKQGYFLKYFPARIRNVGEDAKEDRKLIYAFKDARDDAYKLVAQMVDGYFYIHCVGSAVKSNAKGVRRSGIGFFDFSIDAVPFADRYIGMCR